MKLPWVSRRQHEARIASLKDAHKQLLGILKEVAAERDAALDRLDAAEAERDSALDERDAALADRLRACLLAGAYCRLGCQEDIVFEGETYTEPEFLADVVADAVFDALRNAAINTKDMGAQEIADLAREVTA